MCREEDNITLVSVPTKLHVFLWYLYSCGVCPLMHFLCLHFKVYTVVDEMFLAGEIRETSQTKVLKQLLMLQSLE